jgi:hypothetical protein
MTIIKKLAALTAAAVMMAVPAARTAVDTQFTASAAGLAANENSDDLLLDCSSRFGYDYLAARSNGAQLRKLYDIIWNESVRLWNDPYADLYDGIGSYAATGVKQDIASLGISEREAAGVLTLFRNDNPLFFWLTPDAYFENGAFVFSVEPGLRPGRIRSEAQQQVTAYIKETAVNARTIYGTSWGKAYKIHNVLVTDLSPSLYDKYNYISSTVYGAAKNRICTSEGYSRTAQIMLNYFDIDNYFVSGRYKNERRCWNLIRMDDGMTYFSDIQLDDHANQPSDYDYSFRDNFIVDASIFSATHTVDDRESEDIKYYLPPLPDISEVPYAKDSYRAKWLRGDVSWDEKVNITDLTMIAAHVKDKRILTKDMQLVADINKDGKVNISDITLVAAHVKCRRFIADNAEGLIVVKVD